MHVTSEYLPKYIKQIMKDLKAELDSNTIIVGDFATPFTIVDTFSADRKSIKKHLT